MNYLKIRKWDVWQSYRSDRGQPPWIKVYRSLLRCPEWVELTDTERGQLTSMWLLAADRGGVIPASDTLLMKLCFMSEKPNIKRFMDLGFIEHDANVASTGSQDDANVTAQTRLETDKDNKNTWSKPNGSARFNDWWSEYPKKVKKQESLKVWKSRHLDESADELIEDAKDRKQHDQRWIDGFIPDPPAYLRGKRWEDHYPERKKS